MQLFRVLANPLKDIGSSSPPCLDVIDQIKNNDFASKRWCLGVLGAWKSIKEEPPGI